MNTFNKIKMENQSNLYSQLLWIESNISEVIHTDFESESFSPRNLFGRAIQFTKKDQISELFGVFSYWD